MLRVDSRRIDLSGALRYNLMLAFLFTAQSQTDRLTHSFSDSTDRQDRYLNIKMTLPAFLILCLILASCIDSVAPVYEGPDTQLLDESSYQGLQLTFKRFDYHFEQLDNGVPPLIVQKIPEDLDHITDIETRKRIFFKIMLPLILLVNDEIRNERQQLLFIQKQLDAVKTLSADQTQKLKAIALRYKVNLETTDLSDAINILLRRVDVIPVDLALAQAANESAWGTSRFTQIANNLFGQWTFIPGRGVVPQGRPEGETYEVKKFPTIYDSVRAYANNLNTHRAYQRFRHLRAKNDTEASPADGILLAEGLVSYSTRGEDYVQEIQAMIRHNDLQRLSTVSLRAAE